MFAVLGNALGKIRNLRFLALLVILGAVVLYIAPYLVGAIECVGDMEPPIKQCLGKIYHDARSDTNLAAGIIALAVILAAWRPVPDGAE